MTQGFISYKVVCFNDLVELKTESSNSLLAFRLQIHEADLEIRAAMLVLFLEDKKIELDEYN